MTELRDFADMPGPYGLPILGSAPQLITFPEKTLMQWARDCYGNVFRYRMLGQQCIALNGFEAVKEGLITRGSEMSGRITGEMFSATRDNRGLFFVDHGIFWQKWRKFTVDSVGNIMAAFASKIENEASKLTSGILKNAAEDEEAISLKDALYLRFAQVIFLAFVGKEFIEEESKALADIVEAIYQPFNSKHFPVLMLSPALARIPPFTWYLSKQRGAREKMVEKLVGYIKQNQSADEAESSTDNIASCFYKDDENPAKESEESLALLFADFIFAGSATVAQELMWILLLLMKHSEAMDAIQEEIDEEMADAKSVAELYEASGKSPYIRAVIQEAMRLRPIAPGSLFHKTITHTKVGGYKVPKGVVVFPNLWSVHHDPTLWAPDPTSFRPERHLDEDGHFMKSKHVIPFSVGERQCAGKLIAEADIFIFLVTMLRSYHLALSEDSSSLDMNGSSTAILQTPDFKVIVSRRSCDSAEQQQNNLARKAQSSQ